MTDYQYRSIIKGILGYVEEVNDVEKIKMYLRKLLQNKPETEA